MTATRVPAINLRAKMIHKLGEHVGIYFNKFLGNSSKTLTANESKDLRVILSVLYCVLFNISLENTGNKKLVLGYISSLCDDQPWKWSKTLSSCGLELMLEKILKLAEKHLIDNPTVKIIKISQSVETFSASLATAKPFLALLAYIWSRPMTKPVYISKSMLVREALKALFSWASIEEKAGFISQLARRDRIEAEKRSPYPHGPDKYGLHGILMRVIYMLDAQAGVPNLGHIMNIYSEGLITQDQKEQKEQKPAEEVAGELEVSDDFVYDDGGEQVITTSASRLSFLASLSRKPQVVDVDDAPLLGGPGL